MNRLVVISKREHFEQLLKNTGTVRVTLDSRKPGVDLPPSCLRNPELALVITKFDVDVVAGPTDLQAKLSFDMKLAHVQIPWNAIFAITDDSGDGILWEEDAPAVVLEKLAANNPHKTKITDPLDSTKFRAFFNGEVKTTRMS